MKIGKFVINMDDTKTPKQYSKVWMSRWQIFVMWWLSIFFIADLYFNHGENLETLCITLVTSIVASIIPYFAKSYLETKQEKIARIQQQMTDNNIYNGYGTYQNGCGTYMNNNTNNNMGVG